MENLIQNKRTIAVRLFAFLLTAMLLVVPVSMTMQHAYATGLSVGLDTGLDTGVITSNMSALQLAKAMKDELAKSVAVKTTLYQAYYKAFKSKVDAMTADQIARLLTSITTSGISQKAESWTYANKVYKTKAASASSSGSSGSSSSSVKSGDYGTVIGNGVYLRKGPGLTYDTIGKYNKGQRVTVLKREGTWYYLQIGTTGAAMARVGYMSGDYVLLDKDKTTSSTSLPWTATSTTRTLDDVANSMLARTAVEEAIRTNEGKTAIASESTTDAVSAEWDTTVNNILGIFTTLAATGGAVGLSFCGIEYAYGDADIANKAKNKAIIIALCVIALPLMVYAIKLGASVGKSYAWNPASFSGTISNGTS